MVEVVPARITLANRITYDGLRVFSSIAKSRTNNCTVEAKPTLITLLGQHAFAGLAHDIQPPCCFL